ncbi:ATP-binding protein [Nocardia heshunensis]
MSTVRCGAMMTKTPMRRRVGIQLGDTRPEHPITRIPETRECIVVACDGEPEGDAIVRRAARIAGRNTGADLLAVHVTRSDGLVDAGPDHLARQRRLVEDLGGSYHQVIGNDIPTAILDFARGVNATQLVLGASRRGPLAARLSAGVGATISVRSDAIDVHLVPHERTHTSRRGWHTPPALSMRRRLIGLAAALVGLPGVLAAALAIGLPLAATIVLLFGAVVTVALIGGLYPAALAAVGGFALLDYFLIPPKHSLAVGDRGNLLALVIFLVVAVAVSATVEAAARRTAEAARAHAESDTLSTLAGSVLRGDSALPALLERVRESFGMDAVTLLERQEDSVDDPELRHDPDRWRIVATSGGEPCTAPGCGDVEVPADDRLTLALRGRRLEAADQRVAAAFAVQAAVALKQQRLAEQAAAVAPLTETDRMRTALLAAVSHDLRTPLAGAMAAVTSLQDNSVEFSVEDRDQLLDAAAESLTRLNRLVTNLLDMSRLQAGVIGVHFEDVTLDRVLPRALHDLDATGLVDVAVDPLLPAIRADSVLLERVLVNLVANALRYSPDDRPPTVAAVGTGNGTVRIQVIDHGPGIDPADHERVFLPFQRLGDRHNGNGIGLGLALARGLAEAMGATIVPEATPGGGLTMTVTLERAI